MRGKWMISIRNEQKERGKIRCNEDNVNEEEHKR